ncbi:MAG TPA: hypothetical protein DCP63_15515 [Bacteroidetes bacterium]|nr:hypothetical protein [Bacteroidota bacterium]
MRNLMKRTTKTKTAKTTRILWSESGILLKRFLMESPVSKWNVSLELRDARSPLPGSDGSR